MPRGPCQTARPCRPPSRKCNNRPQSCGSPVARPELRPSAKRERERLDARVGAGLPMIAPATSSIAGASLKQWPLPPVARCSPRIRRPAEQRVPVGCRRTADAPPTARIPARRAGGRRGPDVPLECLETESSKASGSAARTLRKPRPTKDVTVAVFGRRRHRRGRPATRSRKQPARRRLEDTSCSRVISAAARVDRARESPTATRGQDDAVALDRLATDPHTPDSGRRLHDASTKRPRPPGRPPAAPPRCRASSQPGHEPRLRLEQRVRDSDPSAPGRTPQVVDLDAVESSPASRRSAPPPEPTPRRPGTASRSACRPDRSRGAAAAGAAARASGPPSAPPRGSSSGSARWQPTCPSRPRRTSPPRAAAAPCPRAPAPTASRRR